MLLQDLERACLAGNLSEAQAVHAHLVHTNQEFGLVQTCLQLVHRTFDLGLTHITQWLVERLPENVAFREACATGNLQLVKWLHGLPGTAPAPGAPVHGYQDMALLHACSRGHADVAVWLLTECEFANDTDACTIAFEYACLFGYLEHAQLMHAFGNVSAHSHQDRPFQWACSGGHLHVAQWLMSLPGGVYAQTGHYAPLRLACANGHLHVAKWLLEADPSHPMDDVLLTCVSTGNLAGAKFIWSLAQVDIHADGDRAFVSAMMGPDKDVALWLVQLDPSWDHWPEAWLTKLKGFQLWSSGRDAWMRSVVRRAVHI
jgi:hypothetical protein